MSKSTVSPVLAADVRAWFLAEPKRLARLSEAGQANVRAKHGRISREVATTHNKSRRTRQYTDGNTKVAQAEARTAAAAKRASLAESGVAVGKRGPLPGSVRKTRTAPAKSKA